jgi:hypothetical protein
MVWPGNNGGMNDRLGRLEVMIQPPFELFFGLVLR